MTSLDRILREISGVLYHSSVITTDIIIRMIIEQEIVVV